jgi:DNA-binding Lrp family transcriptional regulator
MSKKSREAIRNNLAQAIAPPMSSRKRSSHLDGLLDEYAPPEKREAELSSVRALSPLQAATTPDVAPPKIDQPPLQTGGATPDVAPPRRVEGSRFTSIPNDVFDVVLPALKPVEQLVLLRLYRLTRGFQTARCTVSIGTLAKRCSIGTTAARNAAQELERRGFIRRIGSDLMNSNQQARGVEFEMLLPAAASTRDVAPARSVAPPSNVAPPSGVAYKVNTQKENTQTQDAPSVDKKLDVRVGSKFTIEECRRYAKHLQATGQGITNPGGYATIIKRTGEADELIENFLNPATATQSVDTSACPDCQGSGFYYPDGINGGVAKCKHLKTENPKS